MENTEINLNGRIYPTLSKEDIENLLASSSGSTPMSTIPFPGPSIGSGTSIWSSGTVGSGLTSVTPMSSPTFPLTYLDYVYDMPEQLVTYSKDEVLNKILNEMADEVEGKVKPDYKIPTGIDVVDPYDFTVRTFTSTTATPFTTTTPSSWRIIR